MGENIWSSAVNHVNLQEADMEAKNIKKQMLH